MIVEIADTTLEFDRTTRQRVYARAQLPAYWIVNLINRQIEVYGRPSGPTANPGYGTCRAYNPD